MEAVEVEVEVEVAGLCARRRRRTHIEPAPLELILRTLLKYTLIGNLLKLVVKASSLLLNLLPE